MNADSVSAAVRAARLGEAGVVIEALDGPAGVRLEAGRPFAAASMIKTPIAAALTEAWATGRHAPAERLVIEPSVMTENDAESPLVPGFETTLEEAARLMLVRSDNVATNALIDRLDRRWISERARAAGLSGTVVRRKLSGGDVPVADPGAGGRNVHPPEDAARLFAGIARGELPGAAWLAETLARQEWNDKLSTGLAAGDHFAHKTGDTSEASHDGGIVTLPDDRRFVVVVYTALPSSHDADRRLGDFMRRIRPLLEAAR